MLKPLLLAAALLLTMTNSPGGARFIVPTKDEVARITARALHRAEPALKRHLAAANESTVANSWHAPADRATLPPGVAKYLRDAGIAN